MEKVKIIIMIIINYIVTFFHYLLGGIDIWLKTLIILMFLDVITGLSKAYIGASEKSKKGFLDSTVMWQGGIKKLLTFVVICVATVISSLLSPDSTIIRDMTTSYYIATEALSVMENVSACGLPLPTGLTNVLEKLKSDNDK